MPNNTTRPATRSLDGLKVLVIGGSGGIGFATAKAAAGAGAIVTMHGRSPDRLAERSAELASPATTIATVCADLSAGTPTEELLVAARTSDILVVAYGPFIQKPLALTDMSDWKSMALTCLALPGILASEAATSMASRGFGRILLFGGTRTDAIRGYKTNAAYAAAKTGLGVLAKSIAGEFGMHGVSCAVVCPGFVATEYTSPATKNELGKVSPRGTMIPVIDVADLALYLIAGGMDLVNGSIIAADTGLYAP